MSDERTKALRPGAVLEMRMVAAYRDGEATAKAGEPRVNPWSGTDAESANRVLAVMWARGFTAGNPMGAFL